MRTVRSSGRRVEGVYPNMHWSGGVYPACTGRGVHPPPWTEWQMLVKILPCLNYIADSNYFTLRIRAYLLAYLSFPMAYWRFLHVLVFQPYWDTRHSITSNDR